MLHSLLAPFRAPELVTVHSSGSTRLKVKWSYLPEKDFQGKPLGYSLTYYPVDLEIELKFMSVNDMMNTTTLTNLAVYTMYVINVSAVSSGGVGPAKTGKGRTGAEGTKFSRQHRVRCVTPIVKGMQKKCRMRTCVQSHTLHTQLSLKEDDIESLLQPLSLLNGLLQTFFSGMLSCDVCESSEEVHYILESLLIKQFLNHEKDNQTLT